MVGHESAGVLCVSLSVLCLLSLPLSLYFISPFLRGFFFFASDLFEF